MPNDSQRLDVAVFIDFENVYVSVRDKLDSNPNFEMIMDRCEDFGRVVIARAYADWYRYPRVTSALYANGIEPMYVPTYYYDREMGRTGRAIKNSVDMNLCIDAMKTLFTNTNIAKFVLATGDRDFIPLVNSIRQQGKEVIIIGIGGAASAHLAQSADEFIFYESLVGKKPNDLQPDLPKAKMPEKGREYEAEAEAAPPPPPRSREREREREREPEPEPTPVEAAGQQEIYDTLVNAINLARERGYVCSFGSLKLLMKELMGGDFKEARYKDAGGRPFAKFKDFVLEAERRGKVQVFTRGTVNEVFLPGEDPFKLSQFAQEINEEPGAQMMQVAETEVRPESRPSVVSNGRRRRRRSRGGQRGSIAPGQNELEVLEDEGAALEDVGDDELALPDLPADEAAPAEEPAAADARFDDLRDQAVDEAEQLAPMLAYDPAGEELLAPIAESAPVEPSPAAAPAEPAAPAPSIEADALAAPAESLPFTEVEWQTLRTTVAAFERPVSFAHIHDAMRNARNSAGISRTNEELRSLIKQAINTGVLERLGKGNRASYQLAPAADAVAEGEESALPVSAPDVGPSEAAPAAEPPPVEAAPVAEAAPAEAAAGKAPRNRPRRKAAAEAAPAEAAPAPAAEQPSQSRSRRKKAAPPAEPPAAPAPVAEPAPAPKRSRRKKSEGGE